MLWLKRVGFFILLNFLVLATISIIVHVVFDVMGVPMPQGYEGLFVMCAIFGFTGSFISLMLSKWIAKRSFGVVVIDPKTRDADARQLLDSVYALARRAGIQKMPEVGVFDSPVINAFATGPTKNSAMVAVSSGLLRAMNHDEVEGVLGHEITHIANGDMVTMTLLMGVVNTFVMFFSAILTNIIMNALNRNSERRGGGGFLRLMINLALQAVFMIFANILIAYFSRRREFRADAGGARLAGKDKMLAGLRKLQAQFDQIPADNNASTATLGITSKPSGLMKLYSSHPPLEERIKRLERGQS